MTPSLVHSVNSTSATRVGSTKTDSRGGFGPSPLSANGDPSRRSSTCERRSSSASVKPVPTRPAKRSLPSSSTPTSSAPMRSVRLPVPGTQPPTTTSSRRTFLTFSQHAERRPGSYGLSRRFATTPSRPASRLAASTAAPSPTTWSGVRHAGPSSSRSASSSRRSAYVRSKSAWPSSHSRSKAMNATGTSLASRLTALSPRTCIRCCRRPKLGRPCSSKATISPSRIAACELSARFSGRSSG